MDTIYYTFNTRRLKVSGGPDLLTFVPAPAPAPAEGGQVLDFARCRQRLETKGAWKTLSRTAEAVSLPEEAPQDAPEAAPAPTRRERRENWLDLAVSVALLLAAAAAVAAFLPLL